MKVIEKKILHPILHRETMFSEIIIVKRTRKIEFLALQV